MRRGPARAALHAAGAADRAALEARYGRVWDTRELAHDFIVVGFMAPYLVVRRKTDGALGSLEFQPRPRFYHSFVPDGPTAPVPSPG